MVSLADVMTHRDRTTAHDVAAPADRSGPHEVVQDDEDPPCRKHYGSIESMYRRHAPMVLRRAATLLGNETEASEVLQEIFLSLLVAPEQFEGRSAVTTWLYRVTTNRCLNRLRDRKNRDRLLKERVMPALTEEGQQNPKHWATARQYVASMPAKLAQVTIYYAIDGMTQQEIADVMGCSRRHIVNLLGRAREWAQAFEEGKH